jgi:hypothetical protein
MMAYQIKDEPTRTSNTLVINPFWALLGMMLGGAWLGAVLFGLNAVFLRGATWRRELILIVAMILGAGLIAVLLSKASAAGLISEDAMKYALLSVTIWKLAIAYWIFFLQQTSHSLYEYFTAGQAAGSNRFPVPLLLLGAGVWFNKAILAMFTSPFLLVMVN